MNVFDQIDHCRRGDDAVALQFREDLAAVLDTAAGRRLIAAHLVGCGVLSSSWTGDALSGSYREGRRSAGLNLLDTIAATLPALYPLILQEMTNVRVR
jgi:hypothetical protein